MRRATDFPVRYGGEEFIVLMAKTDLDQAEKCAELIRSSIESLVILHEKSKCSAYVTVSIGVGAVAPNKHISSDMLIRRIDSALYKAKEGGRNKIVVVSNDA